MNRYRVMIFVSATNESDARKKAAAEIHRAMVLKIYRSEPNTLNNATKAVTRLVQAAARGEKVRVSTGEKDRRMAICRGCEFFVDNPMKCRKCGCYLNLKTRLETEHCPISKW